MSRVSKLRLMTQLFLVGNDMQEMLLMADELPVPFPRRYPLLDRGADPLTELYSGVLSSIEF